MVWPSKARPVQFTIKAVQTAMIAIELCGTACASFRCLPVDDFFAVVVRILGEVTEGVEQNYDENRCDDSQEGQPESEITEEPSADGLIPPLSFHAPYW